VTGRAPRVEGAAHRLVASGELTVHVVELGQGPAVLLLHGFPEFWWSWRHQLPALAAAGYRAIAVDLPGFGRSYRPRGVSAYSVSHLADVMAGLLDTLGIDRAAAVVGHDWGGVIGYRLAARHPDRVARLAVLNAPHPALLARGLLRHGQALRSAYVVPFLVPGLAERAFAAGDGALLRRTLRAFRATTVPDDELEPYLEAARDAEWLRGGLAMYRAMALSLAARAPVVRQLTPLAGDRAAGDRVAAPVLVVWGERDPFLAPHLAEPPQDEVPHARVERLPDASHDVMLDAPERVNALLVELLRGPG
jgi:pimeloyl-ACP methyl ester carboxylesterase